MEIGLILYGFCLFVFAFGRCGVKGCLELAWFDEDESSVGAKIFAVFNMWFSCTIVAGGLIGTVIMLFINSIFFGVTRY